MYRRPSSLSIRRGAVKVTSARFRGAGSVVKVGEGEDRGGGEEVAVAELVGVGMGVYVAVGVIVGGAVTSDLATAVARRTFSVCRAAMVPVR